MTDDQESLVDHLEFCLSTLKVVGTANAAGVVGAAAVFNTFQAVAETRPVIKTMLIAFLVGIVTFSVAFTLLSIAIMDGKSLIASINERADPPAAVLRYKAPEHYNRGLTIYFRGSMIWGVLSAVCYFYGLTWALRLAVTL